MMDKVIFKICTMYMPNKGGHTYLGCHSISHLPTPWRDSNTIPNLYYLRKLWDEYCLFTAQGLGPLKRTTSLLKLRTI